MNALHEIQQRFFSSVKDNTDVALDDLTNTDTIDAEQRLQIYVHGYRLRLLDALQDTYPALHTLMGDSEFESLGLQYIDAHPSTHFSLRNFGNQMAAFLASHNTYSKTPILNEMATFEWALRDAFDANDQEAINIADLQDIPPENWPNLAFTLHASVRICRLHWNTTFMWKAIQQEAPPQAPQKQASAIDWIIWRPQLETHFRSMEQDESCLLQALAQGNTFSQLCESLIQDGSEDPARRAAELISRWISEELIVAYHY